MKCNLITSELLSDSSFLKELSPRTYPQGPLVWCLIGSLNEERMAAPDSSIDIISRYYNEIPSVVEGKRLAIKKIRTVRVRYEAIHLPCYKGHDLN